MFKIEIKKLSVPVMENLKIEGALISVSDILVLMKSDYYIVCSQISTRTN